LRDRLLFGRFGDAPCAKQGSGAIANLERGNLRRGTPGPLGMTIAAYPSGRETGTHGLECLS